MVASVSILLIHYERATYTEVCNIYHIIITVLGQCVGIADNTIKVLTLTIATTRAD